MPYKQATDRKGRAIPYVYISTNRPSPGHYYTRIKVSGKWTVRKLRAAALGFAETEARKMRDNQRNAAAFDQPDPLAKTAGPLTVGTLLTKYKAADCPDKSGRSRAGDRLLTTRSHLETLAKFWGDMSILNVNLAACDSYHRWRTTGAGRVTRGDGHRSTDIELSILSGVLNWSARAGHITINPISARGRYHRISDVNHCTSRMPADDSQLHQLAASLMQSDRSASLGWQLLFEALTGCRTAEITRLRVDAKRFGPQAAPGFVDARSLWIHRAKNGIFPWILLDAATRPEGDEPQAGEKHSPLRELLKAHRNWHSHKFPESPWYFPSPSNPQSHIDTGSLSHTLKRICPKLGIHHISSHGLRAYHVRALRSMGIDDSEISKRLGQRSGVSLIETTYGVAEPGWFGSWAIDFLPPAPCKPAWSIWLPASADPGKIESVQFGG